MMKKSEFAPYIQLCAETPLFTGSAPDQIEAMLHCLEARIRHYEAGEYIHRMGDVIDTVGLVLEGSVRIEHCDVWGNANVMGLQQVGDMFGEAYAAVPDEP